jgi:ubiquinol-cytochrome c reductase cytochrome b subunit
LNKLKKIWLWFDDRTKISGFIKPLAKHLVPPDSKWTYVFGSATLFAFILQVITGVALALMYQPTSASAYKSLQYITNEAPLGAILRGIHYFGASAMIILVGIHMIRVYILAAYKYPREMSWISGVLLLAFILGMGFTGQLLRWDSNGVWSAIVGAEQAGRIPIIGTWGARFLIAGDTLGGATLSRFFAFHVFLIPALLFGIIGLHLFLVFKNGISEPPKSGRPVEPSKYKAWYENMLKEKGVPFWPNAAWRDMVFGLLVVVVIIALAIFIGPPKIGAPPDPANINSNPRPDWYFLWIFSLFALMPREIESYAIAFGPIIIGAILIFLPIVFNKGERSPLRRPWSFIIVLFIITMVATLWHEGVLSPWSPNFNAKPLKESVIGNVGPDARFGAKLMYKKACLYCHTISGDGGKRGPNLTKVGERLTADELKIRIVNGGGNMPAFGPSLSSKELNALVAFLKTRNDSI